MKLKRDTEDPETKKAETHLFKKTPSEQQVIKRVATFKQRLASLELSMQQGVRSPWMSLVPSKPATTSRGTPAF